MATDRSDSPVLLVGPRSNGPLVGGVETGIDMLLRSALVERHQLTLYNTYRDRDPERAWSARLRLETQTYRRFATTLRRVRPPARYWTT